MEQQLASVLQQLTTANAQTQALITQQAQETQRLREETARQIEAQREALIQALARPSGVVDVTKIGKPDVLKGNRETVQNSWSNWHFTFITWFSSQFKKAKEILEWSKDQVETITPDI